MIEAGTVEELKHILKAHDKVFIEFVAMWCQPCLVIMPFVEELAAANPDIIFVKVDVDENIDACTFAKIINMPTFISYHKGKEKLRKAGGDEINVLEVLNKLK